MVVYLYLQLSLDFARNLHGEWQSYSVRLHEVPTCCNPTLHRPIEQVSTMCTIESFSFLHQLFNIKVNFLRRVWKQFVKKNKGVGQGKTQLDVRMNFPVCWFATISLSNINCST